MKSTSKLVAAAATLGVLGFAVLPLASYASTTTVEVEISSECKIGQTGGSDQIGATLLNLPLSATTPSGETTATTGANLIGVVCNGEDGWTLTEAAATAGLTFHTTSGGTAGVYGGTVGFTVWTGGVTPSAFADNTWSMNYVGDTVTKTGYHAIPTTATEIASTSDGTDAIATISQQFGAKTDGSLAAGFYGTTITYALTAN